MISPARCGCPGRYQLIAIALLVLCSALTGSVLTGQSTGSGEATMVVAKFDRNIVDEHKQLFDSSCIPMTIEMILKLTKREPSDYFKLQEAWKDKTDGNFSDFDGKTISGLTFHKQFALPRNKDFPLNRMFETIEKELRSGRFVIVSLKSGVNGWHMHVIFAEDAEGDFLAITKAGSKANGSQTVVVKHVKTIIRQMEGTDILTYEPHHAKPKK